MLEFQKPLLKTDRTLNILKCFMCGEKVEVSHDDYCDYRGGEISYICSEICLKKKRRREVESFIKNNINIIPMKYRTTNYNVDVEKYLNKSIFLTGATGTGKTTLMAEICRTYFKKLEKVVWISYPEFIMTLQSMYKDGNDDSPFQYAKKISQTETILAIDDLGVEKVTDYVKQMTYYLINHREQNLLPTIITSNFTLKQIDEQIDTRISSRIAGMCDIVELKGKDKRLNK